MESTVSWSISWCSSRPKKYSRFSWTLLPCNVRKKVKPNWLIAQLSTTPHSHCLSIHSPTTNRQYCHWSCFIWVSYLFWALFWPSNEWAWSSKLTQLTVILPAQIPVRSLGRCRSTCQGSRATQARRWQLLEGARYSSLSDNGHYLARVLVDFSLFVSYMNNCQ